MSPHQRIEQQYRKHSRQRLGQENAKRCEAEDFGASRLQPEAQRRLVYRDETARIKGNEDEISPIIQHTSNGGSIVQISKTVLPQLVEVHEDRDERHCAEAQARP